MLPTPTPGEELPKLMGQGSGDTVPTTHKQAWLLPTHPGNLRSAWTPAAGSPKRLNKLRASRGSSPRGGQDQSISPESKPQPEDTEHIICRDSGSLKVIPLGPEGSPAHPSALKPLPGPMWSHLKCPQDQLDRALSIAGLRASTAELPGPGRSRACSLRTLGDCVSRSFLDGPDFPSLGPTSHRHPLDVVENYEAAWWLATARAWAGIRGPGPPGSATWSSFWS